MSSLLRQPPRLGIIPISKYSDIFSKKYKQQNIMPDSQYKDIYATESSKRQEVQLEQIDPFDLSDVYGDIITGIQPETLSAFNRRLSGSDISADSSRKQSIASSVSTLIHSDDDSDPLQIEEQRKKQEFLDSQPLNPRKTSEELKQEADEAEFEGELMTMDDWFKSEKSKIDGQPEISEDDWEILVSNATADLDKITTNILDIDDPAINEITKERAVKNIKSLFDEKLPHIVSTTFYGIEDDDMPKYMPLFVKEVIKRTVDKIQKDPSKPAPDLKNLFKPLEKLSGQSKYVNEFVDKLEHTRFAAIAAGRKRISRKQILKHLSSKKTLSPKKIKQLKIDIMQILRS
jgi:hypothetical protein